MKVEQAERAAEMQRLEERLAALEASSAPATGAPATPPSPIVTAQSAEPPSQLKVTGDLRLRYEGNYGAATGDWDRGTLRARLGATYKATDAITVGARLVTGDSDNPRSSDVTFSNFADDFEVSLDQAYAALSFGDAKAWGGKFMLPFTGARISSGTATSIRKASAPRTNCPSAMRLCGFPVSISWST